jgi:cell pole-organizing protein PopZ
LLAEIGEMPLQEPEPEPELMAAEPDILELTEDMAEIEPAAFQTVEPQEEVVFEDRLPEPAYAAAPHYQPLPEASPSPPLMSPSTMASVGSAFNSLAHTILTDNARTLEDLVREMLRPMLKAWLDDNLPGMVERIVRAEIERVSRGR